MKYLGALLVIVAGAGFGLCKQAQLWLRAQTLSALTAAIELMHSEIMDRLTPIPELAKRMEQTAPQQVRGFFHRLDEQLSFLGENELPALWEQAVAASPELCLNEAERTELCTLGATLGRFGAQEQGGALVRCKRFFEKQAEAARATALETGRMYFGLGTGAGLIVAIMLL